MLGVGIWLSGLPVSQAVALWAAVAVKVVIGKRKLTRVEKKNLALALVGKWTRKQ
ncbi:uncharacterized protein METZ01_LOCUS272935 [marine metagenome]|uniref:Uncharacterized protein n=1 Tax=marine metagenome TaxID=408172 RepID=A0A382KBH4_9ZZZZ